MTAHNFKAFADLWSKGFRPYTGEVDGSVYERLKCPDAKKAYWVSRWPMLYCFGCKKRCAPKTPHGFQLQLRDDLRPSCELAPHELVALGRPLNIKETALCLGISERQLYDESYVAKTALDKLKNPPIRFTADSVIAEMTHSDR